MRLLLFDLDGTLLRAHGAGRRALNRAFEAEFGLAQAMEGVNFGGKTDPWIWEQAFRKAGRFRESEKGALLSDQGNQL